MKIHRFWQGVRMRRVWAHADPESSANLVTLPASWDDAAADALAALIPRATPVTLATAAEAWIAPIEARADAFGGELPLGDRLRQLLLRRQGAPGMEVWQGSVATPPSYALNLAGFHDPQSGFDTAAFAEAIETAVLALGLSRPDATDLRVGMAGLATLLAALGIAYDSEAARDVGRCLAALLRGAADRASARFGGSVADGLVPLPATPQRCAVPALAEAAGSYKRSQPPRHRTTAVIAMPGASEALLGLEIGGIAPAFSPLTPALTLTQTSLLALASLHLSPEAALARLYAGADPLPIPSLTAHIAMHDAVAPFLHAMPQRPLASPAPVAGAPRRDLPARRRGYTQRASVGGHKVYLRTGEYDDGQLGEVGVTLPKDTPTVRGLMEGFAQAVSLGLQHGVPLSAFVDSFAGAGAGAGCGPGSLVEGDAAVTRASSLIDYVIRSLGASYLGIVEVPAEPEKASSALPSEASPLLPLDLPRERRLRLVSSRVGG